MSIQIVATAAAATIAGVGAVGYGVYQMVAKGKTTQEETTVEETTTEESLDDRINFKGTKLHGIGVHLRHLTGVDKNMSSETYEDMAAKADYVSEDRTVIVPGEVRGMVYHTDGNVTVTVRPSTTTNRRTEVLSTGVAVKDDGQGNYTLTTKNGTHVYVTTIGPVTYVM